MSVPSRAMLLRDPKVMLPKALSKMQSLQGAPMSKNRRPEGLMRMYLQPRHASKGYELSISTKPNAALLGRRCSEPQGAPVAMMRDVGQPVKDHFPRSQVKGLHST